LERAVNVDLIGAINNFKLKCHVTGYIDDESGTGELEFAYTEVPPAPDWHPLNYSDPLVLLPGYPGVKGAKSMAKLFPSGTFRADCTFDFDNGLTLRKGANIMVDEGGIHTGGYYMFGSSRSGNVEDRLGKRFNAKLAYVYREYMHPAGPGQVIGIGLARWPTKRSTPPVEAVVSSRYRFADQNKVLPGHFIRTVEIPQATWDPKTKVVKAMFKTRIEPL
jgi:hypothetical protein